MTKVTVCMAGALGLAILVIVLLAQHHAESSRLGQRLDQERSALRQEVDSLRAQLAQARPAAASDPQSQVSDSELERLRLGERDLLRLRAEVGRLREQLRKVSPDETEGTVLKGNERYDTPETYQPPVEITVVAKTDSTNLRLAYAADQVIFNWELDESELRVDGGPASGQHRADAGRIPVGEFVTIKWIVTPTSQEIFADGQLRFSHLGDYSQINRPVSVFPARGSTVTIKALGVKRLPPSAR